MNKHQEALNSLRILGRAQVKRLHKMVERDSNILQKLVDKETPKKAIISYDLELFEQEKIKDFTIKCPSCNKTFFNGFAPHSNNVEDTHNWGIAKYCGNCGQHLDWSEENEQNT